MHFHGIEFYADKYFDFAVGGMRACGNVGRYGRFVGRCSLPIFRINCEVGSSTRTEQSLSILKPLF
jgi:hypothetical protein